MSKIVSYRSIKKISGWLHISDFEIFRALSDCQNPSGGAIVEVGVHHGKSFIPLAAFSEARKLYVIDIFGDQSKNTDRSGSGDEAKFIKNVRHFEIDEERIKIDRRMSSEVSKEDILDAVGAVSFFHIDGGHHFSAVKNDTTLAMSVVGSGGLIAIDDVFRPEWPEVSMAAFSLEEFNKMYRPFAIGFNKTYFCEKSYIEKYQTTLLKNDVLRCFLTKTYVAENESILIFQRYPLPEWTVEKFFYWFLSIYFPHLFLGQVVNTLSRLFFRVLQLVKRTIFGVWRAIARLLRREV